MISKNRSATILPMRATKQTVLPIRLWHRVALKAYSKAKARGFHQGHGLDYWLEAERERAPVTIDEELAA